MIEQLKKRVYEKAAQQGITLDSVYENRINYELEQFAKLRNYEKNEFEGKILFRSIIADVCHSLHIPISESPKHLTGLGGASLIYYLLGISGVDPIKYNIPFLNAESYQLFYLEIPKGAKNMITIALSKEPGMVISHMASEIDKVEDDDLYKEDELIKYNDKLYHYSNNVYYFGKYIGKNFFTIGNERYIVSPRDNRELAIENIHFTNIIFIESIQLALLRKLYTANPDSEVTKFNDEKVFPFLKWNKPDAVISELKMKEWLEDFPLSNISDLSAFVALSKLNNDDFVADYIEKNKIFSEKNFFETDKRVQAIFARGNGLLLYHEQIIDLIMVVLKCNLDEAWKFRNTRMFDEHKENKSTPVEIIDQLKEGLKTNTSLASSSHQSVWMAILDFIPYTTKEIQVMHEAQILYQLAYYNYYYLDIFQKCYDEIMVKAEI
ncbi:MAG TPA: hypothetical protein VNX01_11820 [Bacteroidia bacterium]|nr:hypothetical protein [Bacteroidia bacterium]